VIAWLLYSLLVSFLVTTAAHAVARLLRLHTVATRWVWFASLLGSVLVPAVWPRLPRSLAEEPLALMPATFTIPLDAVAAAPAAPSFWNPTTVVIAGWLAVSALLLFYGAAAALWLRSARARWSPGQLAGEAVLISDGLGPAVIGVFQPMVVVPRWVQALSPAEQSLVVAHEREHIAARDPLVSGFARLMLVIMPWNPLIWWQVRRLRDAIELDCDARLLARQVGRREYAELLLNVGDRCSGSPLAVPALSEPRSLLERRIRRMVEERPQHRWLRTAGWALVAALAFAGVFRAPLPRVLAASAPLEDIVAAVRADTVRPELQNPNQVREATRLYYPALLRDGGIEGTARLVVQITERGTVASVRLQQSSGRSELDAAALKVAGVMRFNPAQLDGRAVAMAHEVSVPFVRDADTPAAARDQAWTRLQPPQGTPGAPQLLNRDEVSAAVSQNYPASVRASGIGGRVHIKVQLDENGNVTHAAVAASSGVRELDESALAVARVMRFQQPANRTTQSVEVPVDFRPADPRPAAPAIAQPTVAITEGPSFTPFTVPPKLVNSQAVQQGVIANYPPVLREAGIGGTVTLWFFIDETGRITKLQMKKSSGHQALDEAALRVADLMQFSPALNREERVKVWVDMPIVFKPPQEIKAPELPPPSDLPMRMERGRSIMIMNTPEVRRAMQRFYPPLLRDAGIGGVVGLQVTVDPNGVPVKYSVQESSGHQSLDQAALKVAEVMRFEATGAASTRSVPITFSSR
jgi:TonB family protein